MTLTTAIQKEMTRYLKACEQHRNGDAHRHLMAMRRLQRRSAAPLSVHEQLKFLSGV